MENGVRDAKKAERVLRDRSAIESFSGSVKRCLAAAKCDVLHGGPWGEIGQLEVDAGRPDKAAAPLLIAAFADQRSASWVLALAAALAANLEEMSDAIATLALFDFGEVPLYLSSGSGDFLRFGSCLTFFVGEHYSPQV